MQLHRTIVAYKKWAWDSGHLMEVTFVHHLAIFRGLHPFMPTNGVVRELSPLHRSPRVACGMGPGSSHKGWLVIM